MSERSARPYSASKDPSAGLQKQRCEASANERTIFYPEGALRDRIASIEFVESFGGELTVLPTTAAVLGFQVRGHIRSGERTLATAGVTGIQASARHYVYAEKTASFLVRFTTQGAACLGVPVSELSNRSIALEDLLPRARVSEVRERLSEAETFRESVNTLHAFLLTLPFLRDRVIERAFELLARGTATESSVAAVAKALSLSERQLERRMLERVGMTPKRYASLRRFERAAALLGSTPSLARLAQEAGYYDQSHFIREFQRLVGTSPGKFRRAGR